MMDLRPQDCWQLISQPLADIIAKKADALGCAECDGQSALHVLASPTSEVSMLNPAVEESQGGQKRGLPNRMFRSPKRSFLEDAAIKDILQGSISWAAFDREFYIGSVQGVSGELGTERLIEHYLFQGALGQVSPNRWFDEAFYRKSNPDVRSGIAEGTWTSGFEHYCRVGYMDRSPHWLFDPAFYRQCNPILTDESLLSCDFVNSYDHYVQFGAIEERQAHPILDPAFYLSRLPAGQAESCKRLGAFKHFLAGKWRQYPPGQHEPLLSPNFDPNRYLDAHPEVDEQIREGIWHSSVHHYLFNRNQIAAELEEIQMCALRDMDHAAD
jgi:hypothetical protein